MATLLIATVLIALAIAVSRNQARRRALDAATVDFSVDQQRIRRVLGDGRVESVRWSDLTQVEILTVESGPHADAGGVLVLSGRGEDGCLAPLPLANDHGLVERLHRLPGFDGPAFLRAVQAPPPTRTTCWVKE